MVYDYMQSKIVVDQPRRYKNTFTKQMHTVKYYVLQHAIIYDSFINKLVWARFIFGVKYVWKSKGWTPCVNCLCWYTCTCINKWIKFSGMKIFRPVSGVKNFRPVYVWKFSGLFRCENFQAYLGVKISGLKFSGVKFFNPPNLAQFQPNLHVKILAWSHVKISALKQVWFTCENRCDRFGTGMKANSPFDSLRIFTNA